METSSGGLPWFAGLARAGQAPGSRQGLPGHLSQYLCVFLRVIVQDPALACPLPREGAMAVSLSLCRRKTKVKFLGQGLHCRNSTRPGDE
jgi:hypothetical protein